PVSDVAAQLRRAAISVSANIAEGAGASSHALFARHLGIALASANESDALLQAIDESGLAGAAPCATWRHELSEICAMLQALRMRVSHEARIGKPPRQPA
ncbi:MAG TPA: four helix bundle protein, partial [Gemmatimonadaceae bacterium]|nr:four helix bundle protein [Gemmatimonadaceae bacterium]